MGNSLFVETVVILSFSFLMIQAQKRFTPDLRQVFKNLTADQENWENSKLLGMEGKDGEQSSENLNCYLIFVL